jgi:hypothetical protein
MVRRGRVLQLDGFEPRVFARRLVEVAVDADVSGHGLFDLAASGSKESEMRGGRLTPHILRLTLLLPKLFS